MLIEAVVPEPGIEALHEGILRGLSWLDKVQGRAAPTAPEKHGFAGQFRPLSRTMVLGEPSNSHQPARFCHESF